MIAKTDISAYGCYRRACFARQDANLHGLHVLRYAALELRFSIERYLWETMDHLRNGQHPKRKEKLWNVGGLEKAIRKVEPQFVAKLEFMNLMFEAGALPAPCDPGFTSFQLRIPNLSEFDIHYGKIGGYLHAEQPIDLTPLVQHAAWWVGLEMQVRESLEFIEPYVSGRMARFDLNPIGKKLFDDYASGQKTREKVLVELAKTSSGYRWSRFD